ncbi:UDP-N-acetylmuramate dehydrogenase [Chlorobium sp.]|uniref:UDP-N-acetylmuramate dehydrogenase n=1 Tax=Chlorobium sp. TaxID=1095 RepID=UPI002F3E4D84
MIMMPALSLSCPFETDVSLREKSYYRIGGRAAFFATPETVRQTGDLLLWNHEQRLPLAVMGSGSNMLFSDEPFPGIVLSTERMNRMFWISHGELFCEAGVENTEIALELLRRSRAGGEWLYRLPGRIGGTVRMNARCFGGEISMVVSSVVVMDADGSISWLPASEVFIGYKSTSLMRRKSIVLATVLRFPEEKAPESIRAEMEHYESERRKLHHFDFPSCGSTFRNNYDAGRPSGRIFEELGFKGTKSGDAEVSTYHANFIFNTGNASSSDILLLAGRMRREASLSAGVDLELEVECTGLFGASELAECGVSSVPAEQDCGKAWAGMLLLPGEDGFDASRDAPLPRTLIQGHLSGYRGEDFAYSDCIAVSVEQLQSVDHAARNPMKPFLRWTTLAKSGELRHTESRMASGEFVDELWTRPVSELFIGHGGDGTGYLEFEMDPSGDWVAIEFSRKRERVCGEAALSPDPWKDHLERFSGGDGFGMTVSYRLVEPFLHRNVLSLQCCASTGNGRLGLFPWWHASAEKPDFHQPDRFFRIRLL